MTNIEEIVTVTAQSTFGRDGAMFEGLLGFVAQLSLGLWSLVILTAIVRFVGMRIYRHSAARQPLVEIESEPTQSTPVPADVTAPVMVPHDSLRNRHVAPVSRATVSSAPVSAARAPDSVEA